MTMLAVSIFAEDVDTALARAAVAAERGADIVEYRLDRFSGPPDRAAELVRRSPLPCIVTCRPTWEGGEYAGDESARMGLLAGAAAAVPESGYVDLELAAPSRLPGEAVQPRLILSSHDFDTRPQDLIRRVERMIAEPACNVAKLAWRARSLRDNLEAFELLRTRVKPMIALCMGEFGLPSRVLAGKFGGFLTFAGLDDDATTAPGQVGVVTMKRLYRWDAINPETRVYGVIGWPVGHSMSPHIHNAGFGAVGFNGVYLPMPIPPEYEHFKATVGAWIDDEHLHFRGASVTIPHKENLIRFVKERGGEVEPLAARIGAANTLAVRDDGSLYASNTDYAAALDAICDAMGIDRDGLAGRRAAVIGAGGAARAIVAGLAEYGATVVIYNRTESKAVALADSFEGGKVVPVPLENLSKSCCEIIVNCTPIGMSPKTDQTPLPVWPEACGERTVVFDTIYNPAETRLLKEARGRGCRIVSGVEMFVRQAAGQFSLWTGRDAPSELFERVVREKLSGVTTDEHG